MSTLTVTLDPNTEQRVSAQASARGLSEAEFIRTLIDDGLDDLDDIKMATDRLSNPLPLLSGAQVRQALGLDD